MFLGTYLCTFYTTYRSLVWFKPVEPLISTIFFKKRPFCATQYYFLNIKITKETNNYIYLPLHPSNLISITVFHQRLSLHIPIGSVLGMLFRLTVCDMTLQARTTDMESTNVLHGSYASTGWNIVPNGYMH
jgi:hypothetical protein